MKDIIFAVVLALALLLVVAGVREFSHGASLIIGGILLAVYTAIILHDEVDS